MTRRATAGTVDWSQSVLLAIAATLMMSGSSIAGERPTAAKADPILAKRPSHRPAFGPRHGPGRRAPIEAVRPVAQDRDCPFNAKVVGKWRGRGVARRDRTDPLEAVRCRLTVTTNQNTDTVTTRLDCRSADSDFTARGSFSRVPGSEGRLSGSIEMFPGGRRAMVSGICRGLSVDLTLAENSTHRGGIRRLSLRYSTSNRVLYARVWQPGSGDRKPVDLLDVSFSR